ncbi:MAG: NHLP bacteriocin system secretion protein [Pseudomonadota bacterium]
MSAMFRPKALSKLKSPEQLDEPLRIIVRRSGIALLGLLAVALLGSLWGLAGKLPEAGRGQGIILTPNTVRPVQAVAAGQVGVWLVGVGEHVKKDQVIGYLQQPALVRQIEQDEAKLAEITERNRLVGDMRARFNRLKRDAQIRKKAEYEQRIAHLQEYLDRTVKLTDEVHERNLKLLETEADNVSQSYDEKARLTAKFEERYKANQRLYQDKAIARNAMTASKTEFEDSLKELRDLEEQKLQLELNRVEAKESYFKVRNRSATRRHRLTQLQLDLQEFDNTLVEMDKQEQEQSFTDNNEVKDLQRNLERDRKRLQRQREIRSPYDGRVLELTVKEGAVVTQGKRLAQVDTRKSDDPLIALSYFKDKVGKQIKPGDFIRVSPSTVQQKRFGSIVGKVVSVSEFAVTEEAVVNYVGNSTVAQDLTRGSHKIEVISELKLDPETPSGFAWTSARGPNVQVTAGTTADAWVTYERRPPASYIMPKIREWTGL